MANLSLGALAASGNAFAWPQTHAVDQHHQAHISSSMVAALCALRREQIEALIEASLALLDEVDGDPDLEPSGDELDGAPSEDEFMLRKASFGPGCAVSDPDGDIDDDRELDDHEQACASYGINQLEPSDDGFRWDRTAMREQIARIRRTRCSAKRDAFGIIRYSWLYPRGGEPCRSKHANCLRTENSDYRSTPPESVA